jgi:hypothetical protein
MKTITRVDELQTKAIMSKIAVKMNEQEQSHKSLAQNFMCRSVSLVVTKFGTGAPVTPDDRKGFTYPTLSFPLPMQKFKVFY